VIGRIGPISVSTRHEELFVSNLALIDRIVRITSRRYRCREDEAEDFASFVKVRLISDDYSVLRKFGGRSSLATYLTTVIQRLFLDHRNQAWGKWRPSAEAKRLGPLAECLERLVERDGLRLDEACQVLRTNHQVEESEEELRRLAERLRPRARWQRVAESEGLSLSANRRPDDDVAEGERAKLRDRVADALRRAVEDLPAEDRLLVRLRIEDGSPVADISRLLAVDSKQLYRRYDALFRALRRRLETEGVGPDMVGEVLAQLPPAASSLAWDGVR
jgi:RNA polymerase sigma factor (sigma-70 family)